MHQQGAQSENIESLVKAGSYHLAFELLPEDVKQNALRSVQVLVSQDILEVIKDESAYKDELISAIAAGTEMEVADLLAMHPQVYKRGKREEKNGAKKNQPQRISPLTPASGTRIGGAPMLAKAKMISLRPPPRKEPEVQTPERSSFSVAEERLAHDFFSGANEHHRTWMQNFVSEMQVPSVARFSDFAHAKAEALRRKAAYVISMGGRLSNEQREVLHDQAAFERAQSYRAAQMSKKRTFSHLLEYVVVMLLGHEKMKSPYSVRRVLKSSPEEDIFQGTDFVVQMKSGSWLAVDLTVSRNEGVLMDKEERKLSGPLLLNLAKQTQLEKDFKGNPDEFRVPCIVLSFDAGARKLMASTTLEYMREVGEGKVPAAQYRERLYEIFHKQKQAARGIEPFETLRSLGTGGY